MMNIRKAQQGALALSKAQIGALLMVGQKSFRTAYEIFEEAGLISGFLDFEEGLYFSQGAGVEMCSITAEEAEYTTLFSQYGCGIEILDMSFASEDHRGQKDPRGEFAGGEFQKFFKGNYEIKYRPMDGDNVEYVTIAQFDGFSVIADTYDAMGLYQVAEEYAYQGNFTLQNQLLEAADGI